MTYATHEVTVRIGGATLLDGVSVEVSPGQIVAVAGPNGAGKSTLLSTLAGDRPASSGAVTLEGRALAGWPRAELARRRAVMGTDRAVAFGFSAREVAMLGRMPLHGGDPDHTDEAVIDALMRDVDCADLATRVYTTLSTGERQRVSLARALAQVADAHGAGGTARGSMSVGDSSSGTTDSARADGSAARYLLLDEPTSSLDPAHQHTAMRLLRRSADGGRGVLAVLHDLNLVAAYADLVVLMRRGRVVEAGSPSQVLRADLLEAVFDIPMLVIPHPRLAHPLVIAEPHEDG
jgi:iron complex transport system ATP-binding protein